MYAKTTFIRSLLLGLGLTAGAAILQAQDAFLYQGTFRNQAMAALAEPTSNWGWVDFLPTVNPNPRTLFRDYAEAFQLGPNDAMDLVRVDEDQLGYQHYRYQQTYRGLRVQSGEFIAHVNHEGRTYSANGKLISGLTLGTIPVLTENEAFAVAQQHADGQAFLWLDEDAESMLREQTGDQQATYMPVGELMIQRLSFDNDYLPSNFRLAWAFDVYLGFEGESRRIYVDALTGEYLNHTPLSQVCDISTGTTAWDGTQTISADEFSLFSTDYRLYDDCTGDHPYNFHTWDLQRSSSSGSAIEYTDLDNLWTSSSDITGVSAHWATHRTRDYYEGVHSRNSWNNADADWNTYNEAFIFSTHNNACWNCYSNIAAFGGGTSSISNTDDWNPPDIVGHEYTHGVVQTTAGLVYSYQSGALNESFADIFGDMVESYARGTNDWLVGADRGAIRSFSNPNAYGDPDTYLGTSWATGTGDNGGVHTNSGVQNHWFYLLSQGGSGTNDNGDAYSVGSIGRFAARDIAYRGLSVYLTSSDQYIDAREASIRAANDLYGSCSNQAIQTGAAWYAVGVGTGFNTNTVCGTITTIFFGATYTGIEQLYSGGTCTTTVTPLTGSVTFRSNERVTLRPGTTINGSSSPFVARIDPCSYTVYRPAVPQDGLAAHPDHGTESEDGLSVAETQAMRMAPNPASHQVSLVFPESVSGTSLRIMDLAGRLVYQYHAATGTNLAVDVQSWPAGLYIVDMQSDAGSERRGLVVEH